MNNENSYKIYMKKTENLSLKKNNLAYISVLFFLAALLIFLEVGAFKKADNEIRKQ